MISSSSNQSRVTWRESKKNCGNFFKMLENNLLANYNLISQERITVMRSWFCTNSNECESYRNVRLSENSKHEGPPLTPASNLPSLGRKQIIQKHMDEIVRNYPPIRQNIKWLWIAMRLCWQTTLNGSNLEGNEVTQASDRLKAQFASTM